MAPALVHFLAGASVFLIVAAPLVLRYELDRSLGLGLVPIGGIWGLVPDFSKITPILRPQFLALHESRLVDVFAFHYTLDTPLIRALPNASTFLSIVVFLLAVGLFLLAQRLADRSLAPTTPGAATLAFGATTAVATGYGAIAWGVVIRITETLGLFGLLLGLEGLVVGWAIMLGCALLGGACLGTILVGVCPRVYTIHPIAGASAGLGAGVVGWLAGIVVVPLWVGLLGVARLSIPTLHWPSLFGTMTFGLVFGAVFALLWGALTLGAGDPMRTSTHS